MNCKIIKATILSLLEKHKQIIVELTLFSIPSNYAELQQTATLKELELSLEQLESLFTNEDMNTIKPLQDAFLELCLQRSKSNSSTCLSYNAIPEGVCNRLFFDIATHLFPLNTFYDLISVLMPEINQQVILVFSDFLAPKTTSSLDRIQLNLETRPITTLDKYPANLSIFTQCVVGNGVIFMMDALKSFPFAMHQRIYTLFEAYPILKKKIYGHNSDFILLHSNIELVNNNGLTPNDMLRKFAFELVRSGTRYTGNDYASNSITLPCHHFKTYMDQLLPEFKEKIEGLETIDKTKTLKKILEEHLAKGECVEQAASYIQSIQNNKQNTTLLNTRPNLNEEQFKTITKKYRHPLAITGFEATTVLPDSLRKILIKNIHITSTFDYIDLFLNLPSTEYLNFLTDAKITCSPPLPKDLVIALDLLNEEQKSAFLNTLLPLKKKFGGIFSVLKFCLDMKISTIFEQSIEALTPRTMNQLLKKVTHEGNSVFRLILLSKNPTLFQLFWKKLNEKQQLYCLNEVDIYGNTSMHYAALHPSDSVFLEFLRCSEKLSIHYMSRNAELNQNFLHLIAQNKHFKTFLTLWQALPDAMKSIQINQKDIYEYTPFHYAASNKNPAIFKFMWNIIPNFNIPNIALLQERYHTLLELVSEELDAESFFLVWESLPEAEKQYQIENGILFYVCKNKNPEVFKKIWNALQEKYYDLLIKRRNIHKDTLLQLLIISNNNTILSYFLDTIHHSDQILLIEERNLEGFSVLDTCIRCHNIEAFHIIWKRLSIEQQWSLTLEPNFRGSNLLYTIVNENCIEILSIILNFLESNKTFSIKTDTGSDIIAHALELNKVEIFRMLWNFLSSDEYWLILLKKENNLLHLAIQKENPEKFFIIWDSLSAARKMTLYTLTTTIGTNVLHFAAQKSHPSVWDTIWNYSDEKIRLNAVNSPQNSLLQWALLGCNTHALNSILSIMPHKEIWPAIQQCIKDEGRLVNRILSSSEPVFLNIWKLLSVPEQYLFMEHLNLLDNILNCKNETIIHAIFNFALQSSDDNLLKKINIFTSILHWSLSYKNVPIFFENWKQLDSTLHHKLSLPKNSVLNLQSILSLAVQKNIKIFFFIWDNLSLKEQLGIILNGSENTFLKSVADFGDPCIFNSLWDIINQEQRVRVLRYPINPNYTFLEQIISRDYDKIVLKVLRTLPRAQLVSLVLEHDYEGSPLLFKIAQLSNRYFLVFWDMFSFEEQLHISKVETNFGSTLIDHVAQKSTSEVWRTVWDFYIQNNNMNAIHRLHRTNYFKLIHWTINPSQGKINTHAAQSILESFPPEKRLIYMLTRNIEYCSVLDLAITNYTTFLFLLSFLSDADKKLIPYIKSQKGLSFLLAAAQKGNTRLVQFLWDMSSKERREAALSERCDQGKTFVFYLIDYNHHQPYLYNILHSFNEEDRYHAIANSSLHQFYFDYLMHHKFSSPIIFRILMESLPEKDRLHLFELQDRRGNTIFHLLAKKESSVDLRIALKYMQPHGILHYFSKTNIEGNTPLHLSAANIHAQSWFIIMSFLSVTDCFKAIDIRSSKGFTPLQQAALNVNPEILFGILKLFSESQRLQVIEQLETWLNSYDLPGIHLNLLMEEKNRLQCILQDRQSSNALPQIGLFSQPDVSTTEEHNPLELDF